MYVCIHIYIQNSLNSSHYSIFNFTQEERNLKTEAQNVLTMSLF